MLDELSSELKNNKKGVFTKLAMDNKGVVSKLLDLRENLRDYKKVITETTLKMKLQSVEVKTEEGVAPNRKINKKYQSTVAPDQSFVKDQHIFLTCEGLRIRRVRNANNTHFDMLKVKREYPGWKKWQKKQPPIEEKLQQKQQELQQPRLNQLKLQEQSREMDQS